MLHVGNHFMHDSVLQLRIVLSVVGGGLQLVPCMDIMSRMHVVLIVLCLIGCMVASFCSLSWVAWVLVALRDMY